MIGSLDPEKKAERIKVAKSVFKLLDTVRGLSTMQARNYVSDLTASSRESARKWAAGQTPPTGQNWQIIEGLKVQLLKERRDGYTNGGTKLSSLSVAPRTEQHRATPIVVSSQDGDLLSQFMRERISRMDVEEWADTNALMATRLVELLGVSR